MKPAIAVALVVSVGGCATAPAHVATSALPASITKAQPVTLTAAQSTAVRHAVQKAMKDPPSARLGGFAAALGGEGATEVCGYVNGKNSFGGYTGPRPFFGRFTGAAFGNVWIADGDLVAQLAEKHCSAIGLDLSVISRS